MPNSIPVSFLLHPNVVYSDVFPHDPTLPSYPQKSASLEETSQLRTAQSVTEHRGMFGGGGLELEWLACFSRLNELLAINLEGSPFISIGLSALHLEKK